MSGSDVTVHEFIVTVLFWAAAVTLCIGLCMVIAPRQIMRLGRILNHWVSTDSFFNRFDTPLFGERFFYRHHVIFGTLIAIGGAYIFYRFMFSFNADTYTLRVFASTSANQWLTGSLVFLNILFSILIMIIGAVVLLRPSLLKGLEAGLNRWFVTDAALKKLDLQLRSPDALFIKRPRLLGFIIVAGSLYIMMNLWTML